jgi:hypothetical protein
MGEQEEKSLDLIIDEIFQRLSALKTRQLSDDQLNLAFVPLVGNAMSTFPSPLPSKTVSLLRRAQFGDFYAWLGHFLEIVDNQCQLDSSAAGAFGPLLDLLSQSAMLLPNLVNSKNALIESQAAFISRQAANIAELTYEVEEYKKLHAFLSRDNNALRQERDRLRAGLRGEDYYTPEYDPASGEPESGSDLTTHLDVQVEDGNEGQPGEKLGPDQVEADDLAEHQATNAASAGGNEVRPASAEESAAAILALMVSQPPATGQGIPTIPNEGAEE